MSESDQSSASFAYHTGRLLGKYQLLSLIDRGGMAEVYKSYHPDLERDLAVKILYPHFTDLPGFIERFRREAKAAAALRHPNIVQIFDFAQSEDGLYYMVLEYINGQSLENFLQAQAPLTLPQTLSLFRQIASATQYAHDHGLIHRDIKPANILLDKKGQAYLTDFGIAQIVGMSRLTQTDTKTGTPIYMAPEQIDSQVVTAEADVYSLGMLLYKMLTNRLPYESKNPTMLMVLKLTEPPIPPQQFRPDLPLAVEQVLLKALANEPEDRFLDVISMTWALEEAYGTLPEADLADTAVTKRQRPQSNLLLNRLDHYKLLELLPHSETALSCRYIADNHMLEKPALVELLKSLDEADGELFRQRMTAVSQLDHPHIAPITFINKSDDGYQYAALEYQPGSTLAAYLQAEPRSVAIRLRLARQIAAALQAIHALRLVHGELQPEMIYVSESEQIWVMGLGVMVGEPSVQDNIQAFGRLLSEMLPGMRVLDDKVQYDSMTAVMTALAEATIPRPRSTQMTPLLRRFMPIVGIILVAGALLVWAIGRNRLESEVVTPLSTLAVVDETVATATAVIAAPTRLSLVPHTASPQVTASPSIVSSPIHLVSITYNPEGEDAEGEYVIIENRSEVPMILTDWHLSDGAQRVHTFDFPAFRLAPHTQVKIWTGRGTDSAAEMYWGSGAAIWNNDGDTARLYDESGQLVAECAYEGGEETAVCP